MGECTEINGGKCSDIIEVCDEVHGKSPQRADRVELGEGCWWTEEAWRTYLRAEARDWRSGEEKQWTAAAVTKRRPHPADQCTSDTAWSLISDFTPSSVDVPCIEASAKMESLFSSKQPCKVIKLITHQKMWQVSFKL